MIYILIEENYAENSRYLKLLEGISSVAKKKHLELCIRTKVSEIPSEAKVAILICQSLKWSTDRIGELNARNIHPLVFGFQYLDTMYKYSSIAPNYTKSAYRLTKYILGAGQRTAILGYNEDSLPDRLKYIGIRYAVNESGGSYEVFRNRGDIIACLDAFKESAEGIENIVCCNDNVAIMLSSRYPELIRDRRICSCSGLKISEFFENPYPVCRINYFEAGVQLAMLYRFLVKEEVIYSTVMTFDMDFASSGEDIPMSIPEGDDIYSRYEIDFYGDESLREMEGLDKMLSALDSTDLAILTDISFGETYETVAEKYFLAVNTVKYRVKKMLENAGCESRRSLLDLLIKYGVKFKKENKTE